MKRCLFLCWMLCLQAWGTAEYRWHKCALALNEYGVLVSPPVAVVPKTEFSFEGISYGIPTELQEVAHAIKENKSFTSDQKKDYLIHLQDAFGNNNPVSRKVKNHGWISRFNEMMLNHFSQKDQGSISFGSFENADEVAVVVHQDNEYQDLTASFLINRLSTIPSLLLVSDNFHVRSQKLFKTANRVQWSDNGSFEVPARATTFHLFGSFCQACVSDAIGSITSTPHQSGTMIDTYVHGALSLELNKDGRLKTASALLAEKKDFSFDDALNYGKAVGLNPDDMQKTVQITKFGPSYTFTFEKPKGSGVLHNIHVVPE